MKKNKKIAKVLAALGDLYPDAICELNYNNDYELLIAVVLSSQAKDKIVNRATNMLFKRYTTLKQLKDANVDDIIPIIHIVGTYYKKAQFIKDIATIIYDKYNSRVPNDRDSLEAMPGVGRKTANVVRSVLFNEACFAVDTHVTRVAKRLELVSNDDSTTKIETKLMSLVPKQLWSKTHHQMVLFGRYRCKAIKPLCNGCSLWDICIEKEKRV